MTKIVTTTNWQRPRPANGAAWLRAKPHREHQTDRPTLLAGLLGDSSEVRNSGNLGARHGHAGVLRGSGSFQDTIDARLAQAQLVSKVEQTSRQGDLVLFDYNLQLHKPAEIGNSVETNLRCKFSQ